MEKEKDVKRDAILEHRKKLITIDIEEWFDGVESTLQETLFELRKHKQRALQENGTKRFPNCPDGYNDNVLKGAKDTLDELNWAVNLLQQTTARFRFDVVLRLSYRYASIYNLKDY